TSEYCSPKLILSSIRSPCVSPTCTATSPSCPTLPATPRLRTKASWKRSKWLGMRKSRIEHKADWRLGGFTSPRPRSFCRTSAACKTPSCADRDSKSALSDCDNPALREAYVPAIGNPSKPMALFLPGSAYVPPYSTDADTNCPETLQSRSRRRHRG